MPKNVKWVMAFESAIDTDVAAAGDPISAIATLEGAPRGQGSGDRVTGRIVRMIHQGSVVYIGIAFDTFYQKGVASPFYAERSNEPGESVVTETLLERSKLTGHGMANWPFGILKFSKKANEPLIVPTGYRSHWVTVKPPQ